MGGDMALKAIVELVKDTAVEWNEDKAPRLAAALAYYTIFSLAPLLIIAIAIAGALFGREAAQQEILAQVQALMGERGAAFIQTLIEAAAEPRTGAIASALGIVTLLFGAGGVFGQLRDALNTIWEVQPQPGPAGIRGVLRAIRLNFLSFSMVLGVGFLLLVSLVISAGLEAVNRYAQGIIPGLSPVWQLANVLLSLAVITLLFALIFRVLPDVRVAWRDVWLGAALTSLLFNFGKTLIGLYLGRSNIGSAYGAAGSLVILLIWVYYSAQIFFFGAEFVQVYTRKYGSGVVPEKGAVPLTEEARAEQGIAHKRDVERAGAADGQSEATDAPGYKPLATALFGFMLGLVIGSARAARERRGRGGDGRETSRLAREERRAR